MTPTEAQALVAKLRSQIGDDVREIYSTEALFKAAADAIDALARQLAEGPAATGWQDIATAPKDGTEFDAWCVEQGGFRVTDLKWGKGNYASAEDPECILEYLPDEYEAWRYRWEPCDRNLTHWHPKPSRPGSKTRGDIAQISRLLREEATRDYPQNVVDLLRATADLLSMTEPPQ